LFIGNGATLGEEMNTAIIEIEEDIRESYWKLIREQPVNCKQPSYKSPGKSKKEIEAMEKSVRRHDIDRRFRAP
jgi:hypothetical protein